MFYDPKEMPAAGTGGHAASTVVVARERGVARRAGLRLRVLRQLV
jgi:hypothetical protein